MKLILLPGNSKKNKEWAKNLAQTMKDLFEKVEVVEYRHWSTKEKVINLDYEASDLASRVKDDDEVVIMAKSAGTILAAKAIFEKKIDVSKCIFMGVPIRWSEGNGFDVHKWFEKYSTPTLFLQNSNDPVMSYADLWDYANDMQFKNNRMVQLEGQSHDYEDTVRIREEVIAFFEATDLAAEEE